MKDTVEADLRAELEKISREIDAIVERIENYIGSETRPNEGQTIDE